MPLLLAVGLLLAAPVHCHHRGEPRAGTLSAARAIAKPVVARRGAHDPDHDYRLVIEPYLRDWLVYQELITDLPVLGGGGLSFRIDRCTGAIRDLHYMR